MSCMVSRYSQYLQLTCAGIRKEFHSTNLIRFLFVVFLTGCLNFCKQTLWTLHRSTRLSRLIFTLECACIEENEDQSKTLRHLVFSTRERGSNGFKTSNLTDTEQRYMAIFFENITLSSSKGNWIYVDT